MNCKNNKKVLYEYILREKEYAGYLFYSCKKQRKLWADSK